MHPILSAPVRTANRDLVNYHVPVCHVKKNFMPTAIWVRFQLLLSQRPSGAATRKEARRVHGVYRKTRGVEVPLWQVLQSTRTD